MSFRPKQFGIVLKNARIDKNLTQAELAENLDISLSYLKDLEQLLSQCDEAQLQTALLYIKTLLSKHEDYINQNNNSIMD